MQFTSLRAYLLTGALMAGVACGSSSPQGGSRSGSTAAAAAPEAGAQSSQVNLEEIFPAGPGRDLVLENCQSCHTFVPIVVLQKDKQAWQHWSVEHRERVANLTEEEFKALFEYLSANFGPHRPVPQLPPALLESWTSY